MERAVSEYRKELLKSAMVAIMSASLLGALTYYLLQPEQTLMPVTFALDEGRQFPGERSMLDGSCIVLKFTFLNGSAMRKRPFPSYDEIFQRVPGQGEYSGEFDATELQRITLSVHGISGLCFDSDTVVGGLVAYVQDRTIDATLVYGDQEMTNLGLSRSFGVISGVQLVRLGELNPGYYDVLLDELKSSFGVTGQEFSSTGYWEAADSKWDITVNQLGDMLHGSGTVRITFTMNVSMNLKYRLIRASEEDLTGSTNLLWAGTLGTLQLRHEEGKISWVNYNFKKTLELTMNVNENPKKL